ncbi:MAG: dipeptidase [Caldilineaceae bacterium]|nr:dipeptidase [Caldilineaceae bacterium]MBP8109161.1 dipeptidase [Caldilineaceae bacterium]MBP8124462.1 dipeptidase [Caldilineaceae bacterium]MBP9071197.1 dipeptidase [Caldilineaceae bacterium]
MIDAKLSTYLTQAMPRQLDELTAWLAIPSISTLSENRDDVLAAAQWLAANLTAAGLENVEIMPTGDGAGHPVVYADWLHAGADRPTVLIYGHYDVQPVDPVSKWHTPPFTPTVKPGPQGDDIFARGAADDKGQTFIHVKAVEALLQSTGKLPVNVKFMVEGEEEIGSRHLPPFIKTHKALLAADVCLISDTHILSPEQPSIIYGLRGMWAGEVIVRGPAGDLHSGMYGGVVHNPNQALAELLAALHDTNGTVTVPGFYDDVLPLSDLERSELARVPHGEAEILAETGVPAIYGEREFIPVERTGARPTLEINGMWGGFTGEGFKTVIPAEARAKISCRLVPNQDPAQIYAQVRDYLQSLAPATISVEVSDYQGAPASLVDLGVPQMKAAVRAYEEAFGAAPIFTREGGSIPIVGLFQEVLGAPVILMGFGLPDDNLHAPNEKLHLPNFYKGIRAVTVFLGEVRR